MILFVFFYCVFCGIWEIFVVLVCFFYLVFWKYRYFFDFWWNGRRIVLSGLEFCGDFVVGLLVMILGSMVVIGKVEILESK